VSSRSGTERPNDDLMRRTPSHSDMVWLTGGTFDMGSDGHYPEEAPVHRVHVDGFFIDPYPVTNRQFRRFVEATGYVTVAEIAPDPKDYPGALPHMLKPGSLVFTPPRHPVDLKDWSQWWRFEFGANWRRPNGRGRSNQGLDDHPVVQIAYKDAAAYAAWAGKDLPTEAEWEYAASGGLDGAEFAWGEELAPGGRHMRVVRGPTGPTIALGDDPPVNFCKPAVDPLFTSAIDIWQGGTLAVVLTGMGSDGMRGGKDIVAAGGSVIAQDEASSVVWGMPGAVANAGICAAILPLNQIAPKLVRLFSGDRS